MIGCNGRKHGTRRGPGFSPRGSFRHELPAAARSGRSGITLIEVLLAMTILLLSLAAIGQLVDAGSDRATETQFQSRGTRLAHSKMAEVEAGVISLTSPGSGTFDDEPEWSWSVEPTAEGTPNLYQVTVKVSRDFKGRPFEVTLSQWLVDPLSMGSAAQAEKPTDSSTTTGGTTP